MFVLKKAAPITLPPWHITSSLTGFEIQDIDGKFVCWVPTSLANPVYYPPELLAAVPDMWNLVTQLIKAGEIADLSPTMKVFVEEARKVKMKVAP